MLDKVPPEKGAPTDFTSVKKQNELTIIMYHSYKHSTFDGYILLLEDKKNK